MTHSYGGNDKPVGKIVRKFKTTLLRLLQKDHYPVIETDFDHEAFSETSGKKIELKMFVSKNRF